MSEPTPLDPSELLPATGQAQPVEGWRAADVDPAELVDDEWIAEHATPLAADELRRALDMPAGRYGAGAGWTRDTLRRIAARTGLPVVEAWSAWNRGAMGTVVAPLLHHTGTAAGAAGDYPTLRIVRDGRSDLQNSLAMFGLGRSGAVYLISERLSWHAGGGSFGGVTDGNGHLAGIEAESDGRSWTPAQLDAYPRLVASILLETGRGADWTPRHADYALPRGRKTDTSGLDIGALRGAVARYLATPALINRNATGDDDDMSTAAENAANIASEVRNLIVDPRIGVLAQIGTVYQHLEGFGRRIENTEAMVARLAELPAAQVAGVDLDAFAAKVADLLAARLAQ